MVKIILYIRTMRSKCQIHVACEQNYKRLHIFSSSCSLVHFFIFAYKYLSCIGFCFPGVPNLKRSELETACEDFSNVIGTSSLGTVHKGTLSSGVEIAVTSMAVKSSSDWSKNLEALFRKKVL